MQRITVDEEAQAAWTAEVRRFHADARLEVEDAAGQRHAVVTINEEGASSQIFEGLVRHFWLVIGERNTGWPCHCGPTTSLHVRVDGRGQLEVWSGSTPVAKWFDADASSEEWLPGLTHLTAGRVRGLAALLKRDSSTTLKSLGLGGAKSLSNLEFVKHLVGLVHLNISHSESLIDLGPLANLPQLTSLNIVSCKSLSDLSPLASLTQLRYLDLSGCSEICDLGPLSTLTRLESLDLKNCGEIITLAPLAGLTQLSSLELCGCSELSDLGPLANLTQLKTLDLCVCGELSDLSPLGHLKRLISLDLSSCYQLSDLAPLSSLAQLTSLNLSGCENLSELGPLAGLARLESLNLSGCENLSNLDPLTCLTGLVSLNLSGCNALNSLSALASLNRLKSLNLSGCENLSDLSPLSALTQLGLLDLNTCTKLTSLSPLADLSGLASLILSGCESLRNLDALGNLKQLTSLDLSACEQISDLGPLGNLKHLESLDLNYCAEISDLGPLAGLTQLARLDLNCCARLSDVSPLAQLKRLTSLDLSSSVRLCLVAPIAALPCLTKLKLEWCANIRDADTLCGLPALRVLKYEESATREIALLASAVRRRDVDLADCTTTAAGYFGLSKAPDLHARHLVAAARALAEQPHDHSEIFRNVAEAFRVRGEVPPNSWEALLSSVVCARDPSLRPAFNAALADLPLSEVERVLAPALLALADVPASARDWALDLAQQALQSVAASASHARDVAPAAAVFFHAQGLVDEVDVWLERGSVAQVPAWRDRVLVALLGRALRSGGVLEARRLLALLQTPERRDEARGLLVLHLSSRAEFRDAAAELDAIVDRAVRASVAANALRQTPAMAGECNTGLSLLLAMDGDPDTLADVLAAMVQQVPDSELVRQIAEVFAPNAGVELGEAVDELLGHKAVAEVTKPKELAALRGRVRASGKFARAALVRGMAALLAAEGLVDGDEAAEVTAALLEDAA